MKEIRCQWQSVQTSLGRQSLQALSMVLDLYIVLHLLLRESSKVSQMGAMDKKKRDLKWLLNLSCEVLPFLGWFLQTRLLLCSQKGIFRNVYMNKHVWYVILNAVTMRSFTNPSIKAEDVSYWYLALRRAAKIQFYDFTVLLHLFLIPPSLHSSGKEVCLSITVSRPKYVEMAA